MHLTTAGLVGDVKPYAMLLYDVTMDDDNHDYKWLPSVADDLTLHTGASLPADCNATTDAVLKEPSGTASRNLLVRVFLSTWHANSGGGSLGLPSGHAHRPHRQPVKQIRGTSPSARPHLEESKRLRNALNERTTAPNGGVLCGYKAPGRGMGETAGLGSCAGSQNHAGKNRFTRRRGAAHGTMEQ